MKSVLVIGATGLIGRNCLKNLLTREWVGGVTVLARRELDIKDAKLHCEIVDFDEIENYRKIIKADVMISTFGTTIKSAGYNRDLFYKWEVDYPLNTARIAFENGCRHFIFVSAAGVSETSPVYYSRTKARMERLALEIGFDAVDIFKPSFLLGKRDEFRLGERIVDIFAPVLRVMFIGPLKEYRPIDAEDVAVAIVKRAEVSVPGVHRHQWSDMRKIIKG